MNQLLIDNWTLQEVAFLIKDGINDKRIKKYSINSKRKSKFIKVLDSVIQIEALFKLLTEIVTTDQLIVDNEFKYVWKIGINSLDFLEEKEIISAAIIEKDSDFKENRNLIIENLNLPNDLMKKHREIVAYWEKHKKSKDNYLSPLIWGTAGNLSRSDLLGLPYSPHPLRSVILENTSFTSNRLNAKEEILNIIQKKRIDVIKRAFKNSNYNIGILSINPIIIDIIESAKSIKNMFNVALQMRDEYKKFRNFILKYQIALNNGDIKELISLNDMIEDVGDKILNKDEFHRFGEFEINLGIGKIKKKYDISKTIRAQIGIRTSIEKLIFQKESVGTLDKLLNLFSEKNLAIRNEIKEYFIKKD